MNDELLILREGETAHMYERKTQRERFNKHFSSYSSKNYMDSTFIFNGRYLTDLEI